MRSHVATLSLGLFFCLAIFGCSKPAQPPTNTSTSTTTPTTPAPASTAPAETQPAPEAVKPKPEPVVIPAGTTLTVRLGQAVGSKISQAGESFSASLATPVEIGGKTAIPANANVTGTVVDAKPLGPLCWRRESGIAIDLDQHQGHRLSDPNLRPVSDCEGQRQANRRHGRRRSGPGSHCRCSGRRRERRSHRRARGSGSGNSGHGFHREQRYCAPGGVRSQLQARATADRQGERIAVALDLSRAGG